MIRSSWMIRKGRLCPALAELVPNCALMIGAKPFLLRFIRPDDPTVQGFFESPCPDHPLANPIQERASWNLQLAGQFGWPPFIGQEPLMVPNARARRFHPEFALQMRNHLGAKAGSGTGRAKACLIGVPTFFLGVFPLRK